MFGLSQLYAIDGGYIPIAMFTERSEKAANGNDISYFHVCDRKHPYKIIHFTPVNKRIQKALLLSGKKNQFLRLEWELPRGACSATYFRVGGFKILWGDGDVLHVSHPNLNENDDIIGVLKGILDDNFDVVLVNIIDYCNSKGKWQSK